jgi:hypothetical protein
MNFPYAPFLIEAQSCNKRCRLFSRKTSTGSGFCPVIVGRPLAHAAGMPHPCFGREHGRNKGEFNSFDGRQG